MPDLAPAVDTVINRCLAVREGEQVLVITDSTRRTIGEALRDGAEAAGGEAVLMVMQPREVDGQDPPATVAAAWPECDVFLAPTHRSLSHTRARKAASEAGARGATLPTVTEDILARLMACDFDLMTARSRAVADLLTREDTAHFTCANGSDMTFDLTGRSGIADDGDLVAPGAFGNLPCGEGFISPLTGSGSFVGTTFAGIGKAHGELPRLTVESGRLVDATETEGARLMELLTAAGELGPNLAELGVGTNERAGITGNILEDEKLLGSVHVAFGASAGIGGTVSVPVHLDVLIVEPTFTVGTTTVLDAGRFVLDA